MAKLQTTHQLDGITPAMWLVEPDETWSRGDIVMYEQRYYIYLGRGKVIRVDHHNGIPCIPPECSVISEFPVDHWLSVFERVYVHFDVSRFWRTVGFMAHQGVPYYRVYLTTIQTYHIAAEADMTPAEFRKRLAITNRFVVARNLFPIRLPQDVRRESVVYIPDEILSSASVTSLSSQESLGSLGKVLPVEVGDGIRQQTNGFIRVEHEKPSRQSSSPRVEDVASIDGW